MLILALRWLIYIPFGLAALGLIQAVLLTLSTVVEGSIIVMVLQVVLLGFALLSALAPLTALALFLTSRICPKPHVGMLAFAIVFVVVQAMLWADPPASINLGNRFWIGSGFTYLLFAFSISLTGVGSRVRRATKS